MAQPPVGPREARQTWLSAGDLLGSSGAAGPRRAGLGFIGLRRGVGKATRGRGAFLRIVGRHGGRHGARRTPCRVGRCGRWRRRQGWVGTAPIPAIASGPVGCDGAPSGPPGGLQQCLHPSGFFRREAFAGLGEQFQEKSSRAFACGEFRCTLLLSRVARLLPTSPFPSLRPRLRSGVFLFPRVFLFPQFAPSRRDEGVGMKASG
jgi:hypothetical protein